MIDVIERRTKHTVDYQPTWDWGDDYVSEAHERLPENMPTADGLLYPQDALKLYELAWFASGPILEIGTYQGLSTSVMAAALRDAGSPWPIFSLDVDPEVLRQARANLGGQGLLDRVTLVEGSAADLVRAVSVLRPGLVFVDGDHSLLGAVNDLVTLKAIVPDGAIIAMHDYEGYEHADPFWTQVHRAVHSSWMERECRFLGRFGITGVFQRLRGGPPAAVESQPQPGQPPILRLRDPDRLASRGRRWLVANLQREDLPGVRLRRGLLTAAARFRIS